MKTIVIDRSKWRTGLNANHSTGKGQTRLQNKEGFMCCLGFITKAYKKKVRHCSMPSSTNCKIPHLTKLAFSKDGYTNTTTSNKAAEINDDQRTTLAEKEQKLLELFDGKFNLVFVGEPVAYKA